jgi:hypothetical protein
MNAQPLASFGIPAHPGPDTRAGFGDDSVTFAAMEFFIGDEYHSFYLGANAHAYQDRLLFMLGHFVIKKNPFLK